MKTEIIFIRQCSGAGAGSLTFFLRKPETLKNIGSQRAGPF